MDDEQDPRQRFAEECRSARELFPERRLNQTQLARMVRVSKSTISRVEICEGPIPPDLPPLLDQVFSTDGLFKRLYEQIAAGTYAEHSRRRIILEPRARAIAEWSPTLVPGLLQTAAYARAQFRAADPRATERELVHKVGSRLARQDILRGSSPPDLSVVVCESVLRRNVGGPKVRRDQLAALLWYGSQPTTVLQVLPFSANAPELLDGSLSILTMPGGGNVLFTEGLRSGTVIEDPATVRHLSRSYDALRASALSREASTDLIRELMEAS
ncbi:helix-turn-helix domain-containing protein [Streptomyces sp. NRRL S-337]|uniref:helix-turn-helix domain-containing protein n=1 Tax=Streptomyces sp. NRRL S-337 TaxID=1463900 RepID=UPI0004C483EC|nr:helix-turn-helix transcriptional regulator [Streptomyces sp. NRRL S-337]